MVSKLLGLKLKNLSIILSVNKRRGFFMRIFIWKLKEFLRICFAVLAILFCAAILLLANVSRFPFLSGERVFYLYSASSQGLRAPNIELPQINNIRGESVCMSVSDEAQAQAVIEQLLKTFHAEVLREERACGVTSYYAYTAAFSDGIYIEGAKINLHVAVCGTRLIIGSPIIFDGF